MTFILQHADNRLTLSTNFHQHDLSDWISQSEAARLRGISRQAVARLVKRGRLAVLEIAGMRLVRKSEVLAFEAKPAGRKPTNG